ncbi:SURF1 family protein [Pseudoalteromonas luteoviolacea]|uniref:SURF1 family protein n=1 Tax=Pseudoalteromonas luteoviolacea TaxID=43657 RepID=UPI000B13FFD5|nr:SURF1 family protein [Pseudoalteromonas luteoviolacea]
MTIVVSVCFRLAFWQWQRAQEKQGYLTQIAMRSDNKQWWEAVSEPELLQGATATISGHIDTSQWWLLDNQIVEGQIGYDLIVLFLPQGRTEYHALNLGFVAGDQDRKRLPFVELPTDRISVDVEFKIGKWSGFTLATAPNQSAYHDNVLQYLDHAFFSLDSGYQISPLLMIAKQAVFSGVRPHYQAVVMSPDKHRAYALQWLLIGISAGVIALFAYKHKNQGASHNE